MESQYYIRSLPACLGQWHHIHTITTTEVSPDLGKVSEIIYKVMSLTFQICFIYLPIPVTGPEGFSMSLVLSWELAYYEISVALQKRVMLVFLEWCTFFVFY
jgi:hypothetical protein